MSSSSLVDLHPFVNSIATDKAAVQAGLTREECNGPTEGHITRLKLIKRSMYGRARFDLLRIRVLSPPPKKLKTRETKPRSRSNQQKAGTQKRKGGDANTPNFQHTTIRVSEVA